MIKVVCLGCEHEDNDTRIKKICSTLQEGGYDVVFLTSYQSIKEGKEVNENGYRVVGGNYDRRGVLITRDAVSFIKYRLTNKKKIINHILDEKPDILHINELELMYVVKPIRSKFPGVKVIFDIHEDYPGYYYDIFKENTNRIFATIAKNYVGLRMKKYLKLPDVIITVTPSIKRRLECSGREIKLVCNYPYLRKQNKETGVCADTRQSVCYCGLLTKSRGIESMLNSADRIHAPIELAGTVSDSYKQELFLKYHIAESDKVIYHGIISQDAVWEIYKRAKVGVCCYKEAMNHYDAYPTKVFEYMMAGIPMVCSFFPAWREIIEGADCGILVDPDNEDEIVDAINYLIDHEDESKRMGENGRKAVEEKYIWEIEADKLLNIYKELIN